MKSTQKKYFAIFSIQKKAQKTPLSLQNDTAPNIEGPQNVENPQSLDPPQNAEKPPSVDPSQNVDPAISHLASEMNRNLAKTEVEGSKKKVQNIKKAIPEGTQDKSKANQASKKKVNYSEDEDANEKMKKALEAYQSRATVPRLPNLQKKTIRAVADYYQVPRSTLNDRIKGPFSVTAPPSLGRRPTFSVQELSDLVNHLMKMASIGYGYTSLQVANLARYLAENCKDKPHFKASRSFLATLYHKFPEISLRKATAYEYTRAKALTVEAIQKFYDVLAAAYGLVKDFTKKDIDPRNVWSLDEVGFRLNDAKDLYVISQKGSKNVHRIASSNSTHVSVIFATNAVGFTLPPYFIVKGRPHEDLISNFRRAGFHSSPVFGTKNAFLNFAAFSDFSKFFVDQAQFNQKAAVLIVDGHYAHTMNLEALEYFNQNKVFTVCIPAHTSHVFNIGDRTVFGCLKIQWRQSCDNYFRLKRRELLLEDFPHIFKEAWPKSLNQFGIINGILMTTFNIYSS